MTAPPAKGRRRGHLADLGELRRALAEQRQQAETRGTAGPAARVPAHPPARHASHDGDVFAVAVGHVVPLRKGAPPGAARARPEAVARQRERDEAAALAESISPLRPFDAESLLDTDDTLSFRRDGIGVDVVRKLRRGVWVLQDEIDLHGLRREQAHDRVAGFLREATRAGLRCVRVVHGKGHGSPGREPVLKASVRRWLAQHQDVLAFTHARPADGGHGALIVLLRTSARSRAAR